MCLIILSYGASAQGFKRDTLSGFSFEAPGFSVNSYDLLKQVVIQPLSTDYLTQKRTFLKANPGLTHDIGLGIGYTGSWTSVTGRHEIYGHGISNIDQVSRTLFTNSFSREDIYFTMGYVKQVGGGISYKPADWFTISGGIYGAGYNLYNTNFTDLGFTADIQIQPHERLTLNFFGQYSTSGETNSVRTPYRFNNGITPQSAFGGTVEFKINENLGITGGFMRYYDPHSLRWKGSPIFGPKF